MTNTPNATDTAKDGNIRELLSFLVGGQDYCIDIMSVREIRGGTRATPLPHAPTFMRGVINLRGRVVPLLDLRSRLSLPAPPPDSESRVVLVESQKRRIGLLVDGVERVVQLAQSAMLPADAEDEAAEVRGLYSEDGRKIRLLDLTAVLTLRD